MSKAKLKKALAAMDKKEIIEVVTELYDARKEAKEYLEYWLAPDSDLLLEKSKEALRKLMFGAGAAPRRRVQASAVSRVLKDFSTLCFEEEKYADLLLSLCGYYADWTGRRMSGAAVERLEKYLEEARVYVDIHELSDRYGLRMERLKENVEGIRRRFDRTGRRRFGWFR